MSREELSPLHVIAAWGLTLTEPLLSIRQRARAEDRLASLHATQPELVHLALAGFISDMIRTLPADDPWRHLSARLGTMTFGPNPPTADGATTAGGTVFGTWRDATDLVPLVHASPFDDPGLVALAGDDLVPAAGVLVAAASRGWEECLMVANELLVVGGEVWPELAEVTDIRTRESYRRGAVLHRAREACVQAARWAVFRRRVYAGLDDSWPGESVFRWGWRAQRSSFGYAWSVEDVEAAIVVEAVDRLPGPVGLGDDEF